MIGNSELFNQYKIDKTDFQIWLLKHNLTMREFAKIVGVSHTYINGLANGKRPVTNSVVELFRKGGYEIKPVKRVV